MKEVTDIKLIQMIMHVFELRELEREKFSPSESIQPIMDIGEISGEYRVKGETQTMNTVGHWNYHAVPDSVALRVIYHLDWRAANSGVINVTYIGKRSARDATDCAIKFYGIGAAGEDEGDGFDLNQPLYLTPGDTVILYCGVAGVGDAVNVNIDYKDYKRG